MLKAIARFSYHPSLFKYLGVSIFQGSWKVEHFEELVNKATNKIDGWATKLLSKGCKVILINYVLGSIPIYMLSAYLVPLVMLEKLESRYYSFLWGTFNGISKNDINLGNP